MDETPVIIVTGASRGLGFSVAEWLSVCGAKVCLVARNKKTLHAAAEKLAQMGGTTLAVRPGVVDTDMQALLREQGPKAMPSDTASYYRKLKEERQLEDPRVPARSIAWLALRAPAEWSGRFLDYDDPRVAGPAKAFFGKNSLDPGPQ